LAWWLCVRFWDCGGDGVSMFVLRSRCAGLEPVAEDLSALAAAAAPSPTDTPHKHAAENMGRLAQGDSASDHGVQAHG
jgi:hypothetical protein